MHFPKDNTRKVKAKREKTLIFFLEQIKADGSWRQWLNPSTSELHIALICSKMGAIENGKPWDSSFFRGTNWGAAYKNDFNHWVKSQSESTLNSCRMKLQVTLKKNSCFYVEDLPEDVLAYIEQLSIDNKKMQIEISAIKKQLNIKNRIILELQTRLDSILDIYRARDNHYMKSIRSLSYED